MIRTREQQKAMYAKMRDPARPLAFPLRGRGGLARRNRVLTATAGTAALGGAALFAVSRRRGRLALTLAGKGGYMWAPTVRVFGKGKHGERIITGTAHRQWTTNRPPEGLENALLSLPGIGKRYGEVGSQAALASSSAGKRVQAARAALGLPPVQFAQGHVYAVSPQARAEVRLRRGIKNKATSILEGASVWKLLGGRKNALEMTHDATTILKNKVGRITNKTTRNFTAPVKFHRKMPAYEEMIAPVFDNEGLLIGKAKIRRRSGWQHRIKPSYAPSKVDRAVTKPLDWLYDKVRRADITTTRRMRLWARKKGLR